MICHLFADVIHTVQRGDTLTNISRRYYTTVEEIKALNNLSSDNINVGQKLVVRKSRENPIYHNVRAGDTLTSLARRYNTTVTSLVEWNQLRSSNIKINQRIIIGFQTPDISPSSTANQNSNSHTVKKGDTLSSISRLYNIDVLDLIEFNKLTGFTIYPEQVIWLEDGHATSSPTTPDNNQVNNVNENNERDLPPIPRTTGPAILPVANVNVVSEFGMRNGRLHKGIDFAGNPGTPILAVLPGRVVFSGVQRGFGNVIIIEHDNYIMTVYGHNESNHVAVGDIVSQGQVIASLGNTGNATAYLVHFEYRLRGAARNPRELLRFN